MFRRLAARRDRGRAPRLRGRVHGRRGRPAQPRASTSTTSATGRSARRPTSRTPAPRRSPYDKIYALGAGLINVAEAKPGDRDFNGGRWAVYPITWAPGVTPVQLTNDHDILAWADAGLLSIADSPVKLFFCSVSPVPPGH